MKLKLYTSAALIAITGLVSCGGNTDTEVVDKSIIPAGSDTTPAQTGVQNTATPGQVIIPGTTAPAVIPGAVTVPSGTVQPQTITMNPQNNAMVTNPQTITQTTAATAPGMNPPHGQPGHRCDISVGAPLNSKPAAPVTAQPATTLTAPQQQPQVTMKEVPTTTKTAPGMNPPHGEAGHRCDIAVGAPLNSKPAPATVTTTAAPATISAPSLLSAPKSDSNKN
ncbi:MAG: hypothetical protein WAT20_07820 [Ferruginibacter sp.]|nr:hypothetical protein [Chitinophagaceae bacterium]